MAKARAHTNIALIKYWGKKDERDRIPLMSSISLTLDKFYTETELSAADQDEFRLNGKRQNDQAGQRVFSYLHRLQKQFHLPWQHLQVNSINHVPTAAGLASSSSAFAALAASFNYFYNLHLDKKQLSQLARMGSGSASRSIYGGFSIWEKGHDNSDSYALAIDEHPTMDLQLLAVELNTHPKKNKSTQGMRMAQSSPFYQTWLKRNDLEIKEMQAAISAQDFSKLGQLAELNANEMHAINLTAQSEFTYFEPETITAIKLVEKLREQGIECYYTIDAGPNLKVLCRLRNSKEIFNHFQKTFPNVRIVQASFGPGISCLD